jgi:hypothetical protein
MMEERRHSLDKTAHEIKDSVGELHKKMDVLHRYMHGDPPNEPGLLTRVDRLEGAEERRVWQFRAIWLMIVAGIGNTIRDWMSPFK